MAKSTIESPSGRHPDLWRVEANRWLYSEYASPYERLLASKHERGPGIEQGEELEAADVPDRAAAIGLAHQYLDRHAEEAVGRTSLEIHIRPPANELSTRTCTRCRPRSWRRRAGSASRATSRRRSSAWWGRPTSASTSGATLKTHQYLLRIERGVVTWIGETDTQRRQRRGKCST